MADSLSLQAFAMQHNPWHAMMSLTSNIASVANGTIIAFQTAIYDPAGMCTTGTGAKFTILQDGYYLLTGQEQITVATVIAPTWVFTGSLSASAIESTDLSSVIVTATPAVLKFAAGDTISLKHVGGTSTITGAAAGFTTFACVSFIAPA